MCRILDGVWRLGPREQFILHGKQKPPPEEMPATETNKLTIAGIRSLPFRSYIHQLQFSGSLPARFVVNAAALVIWVGMVGILLVGVAAGALLITEDGVLIAAGAVLAVASSSLGAYLFRRRLWSKPYVAYFSRDRRNHSWEGDVTLAFHSAENDAPQLLEVLEEAGFWFVSSKRLKADERYVPTFDCRTQASLNWRTSGHADPEAFATKCVDAAKIDAKCVGKNEK